MTESETQGAWLAKRGAVIVAHPDDETIWAGGLLLTHPWLEWTINSVCRASDPDRAPRFQQAVRRLGAQGRMADLDDGPDQAPLPPAAVEDTVAGLLTGRYDWLITHSPRGEYTRHRRHEEVGRAVLSLWTRDQVQAAAVWLFAYGDDGTGTLPHPLRDADRMLRLPRGIYKEKLSILIDVYGFAPASFEVRAAHSEEAFWILTAADAEARARAQHWLKD